MSLSGRWKVDAKGGKMHHSVSKRPLLQFVSIKRKDCGEWAIPGVGIFFFCISFSSFIDEVCLFSFHCAYLDMLTLCVNMLVSQGMVDPGEQVSLTLQREFSEEALNSLAVPPSERAKILERISKLFKSPGFQVSNRHPLACSPSHFSASTRKTKISLFSFRSIKVTWMIPETLTMLGWRRSLSTSMMTQV